MCNLKTLSIKCYVNSYSILRARFSYESVNYYTILVGRMVEKE